MKRNVAVIKSRISSKTLNFHKTLSTKLISKRKNFKTCFFFIIKAYIFRLDFFSKMENNYLPTPAYRKNSSFSYFKDLKSTCYYFIRGEIIAARLYIDS